MKKPLIGIVPLVDLQRESYWMLPGYMEGIAQAGGIGVMLPLTDDEESLRQLLDRCDGLLVTGGQDLDSNLYAEADHSLCGEIVPTRDAMEMPLLRMALDVNKPILGICRGLQALNVVLGGTLYQDIPTQCPSDVNHRQQPPYHEFSHTVSLASDAPLAKLLRADSIGVNSCHHQAIRDLAPALQVMATAPDGIVEAVCHPEKAFVWAVQWHPEFLLPGTDENCRHIFRAFVSACE